MSYLESLPRRLVTLYLPLFVILIVLLFPFYWMALTSIKPDEQLIDMEKFNPFWVIHPTFKHISKLLFESQGNGPARGCCQDLFPGRECCGSVVRD